MRHTIRFLLAAAVVSLCLACSPTGSSTSSSSASAGSASGGTGGSASLTSIQVTPAAVTLPAGSTQQFTATGTYSDGSSQDLSAQAVWGSGSAGTAVISATGLATGVADGGPVTVSASLSGIAGTAALTVDPSVLSNDTALTQTEARITALFGSPSSPVTPSVDESSVWDTYVFQVLTQPANGTAAVVNNQLVYTPGAGFSAGGQDSFTFSAANSEGTTVTGNALVHVMSAAGYAKCIAASISNGAGGVTAQTTSKPCGVYNQINTRATATGTNITVQYAVFRPSTGSAPKALVVLIAGGALTTGITGVSSTAQLTATGGNFLVRTAQLYADAGYLAVVIDCPTDEPTPGATDPTGAVDQYRISAAHAVDILQVLRYVNRDNLHVFLAGTSKGSISVVAQNLIAAGIDLSSPTDVYDASFPTELALSEAGYAMLQPASIQRPAHVLWNSNDLCFVVVPSGLPAYVATLQAAGVTVSSDTVSGGFEETVPAANYSICGAFDYHGYMGIEPTSVATETIWLDARVAALAGVHKPLTAYVWISTPSGTQTTVDLSLLARDLDGNALGYALTSGTTVLGGTVTLNGSVVTYVPPVGVSNQPDEIPYVVTDGKGGVGAAIVSVHIGL